MFIHSEWQFQHSPKMMSRVLPWATVGIDEAEVEEGDTLLDWRHAAAGQGDERGLRYVHLFSKARVERTGGEIEMRGLWLSLKVTARGEIWRFTRCGEKITSLHPLRS